MQTTVSLGIDIGGTNIAFGLIDKSGNCLANGSLPTTAYNTPQAAEDRAVHFFKRKGAPPKAAVLLKIILDNISKTT